MGSGVILPQPGQPTEGPDPSFKSASIPNIVTFAFTGIEPPSGLYVQRDDRLALSAFSNLAGESVAFHVRFLRLEVPLGGQPDAQAPTIPVQGSDVKGTIIVTEHILQLPVVRTIASLSLSLGEGFILSIDAAAASAATRGRTYVRAEIVHPAGPTFAQLFMSDYTDANASISWPGSQQRHYTEGPGWIHSLNVANPAAGTDWLFTVPANARMRIVSLQAQLATSAAVANRNVQIFVNDGVNPYWTHGVAATIPASTTDQITATTTNAPPEVVTTTQEMVLPPGLILPGGHKIGTSTVNIQVGDQWSIIWFLVEEWLDF